MQRVSTRLATGTAFVVAAALAVTATHVFVIKEQNAPWHSFSTLFIVAIGFTAGGCVWPLLRLPWRREAWGIGEAIWSSMGVAWMASLAVWWSGCPNSIAPLVWASSYAMTTLGAIISFLYLLRSGFRFKHYAFPFVNVAGFMAPFVQALLLCCALAIDGVGP